MRWRLVLTQQVAPVANYQHRHRQQLQWQNILSGRQAVYYWYELRNRECCVYIHYRDVQEHAVNAISQHVADYY